MEQTYSYTFTAEERDLLCYLVNVRICEDLDSIRKAVEKKEFGKIVYCASDLGVASDIIKTLEETLKLTCAIEDVPSCAQAEPPKAEQKPEEPKPTKEAKQAKPKAEKPKKSHDPSVLYVSKEDRDPTPRLAYSGKGRRPFKTCATCLLFKGDHCINGDNVTKDHVCDMFEKF